MISEFKIDSQVYKYYEELENNIKYKLNETFDISVTNINLTITSIENLFLNLRVEVSVNQKLTNKLEKEINNEISKTIVIFYGEKVI